MGSLGQIRHGHGMTEIECCCCCPSRPVRYRYKKSSWHPMATTIIQPERNRHLSAPGSSAGSSTHHPQVHCGDRQLSRGHLRIERDHIPRDGRFGICEHPSCVPELSRRTSNVPIRIQSQPRELAASRADRSLVRATAKDSTREGLLCDMR